jgi:Flp pilus assembly pilin Flp
MVEYSLMASLIAITAISAVTYVGQRASTTFRDVGDEIARASDGYDPNNSPSRPPPPPP